MTVTSTAGYDSNSDGRAERGVQFFQDRVRALLSTNIRSEKFQERIRQFWTFAAQHAGEVHKRQMTGEQPCKYEFGQCVLSRVREPDSKSAERLQNVIFLGFASNVTNGYFVMRVVDSGIELIAEIVDETLFPERDVIPERPVIKDSDQCKLEPDDPYTQKESDAVMGFEGGEGWHWEGSRKDRILWRQSHGNVI